MRELYWFGGKLNLEVIKFETKEILEALLTTSVPLSSQKQRTWSLWRWNKLIRKLFTQISCLKIAKYIFYSQNVRIINSYNATGDSSIQKGLQLYRCSQSDLRKSYSLFFPLFNILITLILIGLIMRNGISKSEERQVKVVKLDNELKRLCSRGVMATFCWTL